MWFFLFVVEYVLEKLYGEFSNDNWFLLLTLIVVFIFFKYISKHKTDILKNIKQGVPVPIIITLLINWVILTFIFCRGDLKSLAFMLMLTLIPACIGIFLFTVFSILIIIKRSTKLYKIIIIDNVIFSIYIILMDFLVMLNL